MAINKIPPIASKSSPSFLLNSLNFSTFLSDNILKNSTVVLTNHPPNNVKKKLASWDNILWVFAAIFATGLIKAVCILFSNSDSLPSLNACSANIASLLCFAASLCLSNSSLSAKFCCNPDNEVFKLPTCWDMFASWLDTVVNANEFWDIKLVVWGSKAAGGGTARPVKTLEDTLLLIPWSPPASGEANPCSSSITFLLCF